MDILGVYEIGTAEPCYLIEVEINQGIDIDWGAVTQNAQDLPKENWQVAYDEQSISNGRGNWIFFFHYLDITKPLLYGELSIKLPCVTKIPDYLRNIEYERPF